MTIKVGDFVKTKEGILTEKGDPITNWAGKVLEVYTDYETCLVKLDSITLNALDDDFLLECINGGLNATLYVFEVNDLMLSQRRDTESALYTALENIRNRMMELKSADEYDETDYENWIDNFLKSVFFETLKDTQKGNARFTIDTFCNYMQNYEGESPKEWNPHSVKSVCLEYVPKKVTAEIDFFESYGDIIIQFFKFLDHVHLIDNAKELQQAVAKISKQIPVVANDPRNWGMAKSMMMGAKQSGYDINSQGDINQYMLDYNKQLLASKPFSNIKENPYKNIGRNDKISVKYTDGTVQDNVKFKKVEQDLINGKCELIGK